MHEGKAMAGEGAVIEWAPFRLREGVTESELLEASNAIQRNFLDGRPGFLRRELARHRYFHLMTGSNGNADPGEGVILMRLVRAYPRDAAP